MVILRSSQPDKKCPLTATNQPTSLQLLSTWYLNEHIKNILVPLQVIDSYLIGAVQKQEQFPKGRKFKMFFILDSSNLSPNATHPNTYLCISKRSSVFLSRPSQIPLLLLEPDIMLAKVCV